MGGKGKGVNRGQARDGDEKSRPPWEWAQLPTTRASTSFSSSSSSSVSPRSLAHLSTQPHFAAQVLPAAADFVRPQSALADPEAVGVAGKIGGHEQDAVLVGAQVDAHHILRSRGGVRRDGREVKEWERKGGGRGEGG